NWCATMTVPMWRHSCNGDHHHRSAIAVIKLPRPTLSFDNGSRWYCCGKMGKPNLQPSFFGVRRPSAPRVGGLLPESAAASGIPVIPRPNYLPVNHGPPGRLVWTEAIGFIAVGTRITSHSPHRSLRPVPFQLNLPLGGVRSALDIRGREAERPLCLLKQIWINRARL